MFDCHVHTSFSTDGKMTAEQACEAAIKMGLEGIAFTEHLDYDIPGEVSYITDFDKYYTEMKNINGKHAGSLKILTGVEAGIQPHVIEKTLKTINGYPFDYVIASIHIIDGLDPYKKEFYTGKSKKEAYTRYLEEIYFMVENLESFDMIGHFEYIVRYADYDDRSLRYADYSDLFDMIFRKLIENGRGFELNTGTFTKERADVAYDINLLKRYRELGGELICLGSDAHNTGRIAARFEYFSQVLRDAGFKYIVHFEKRKPVFDRL